MRRRQLQSLVDGCQFFQVKATLDFEFTLSAARQMDDGNQSADRFHKGPRLPPVVGARHQGRRRGLTDPRLSVMAASETAMTRFLPSPLVGEGGFVSGPHSWKTEVSIIGARTCVARL